MRCSDDIPSIPGEQPRWSLSITLPTNSALICWLNCMLRLALNGFCTRSLTSISWWELFSTLHELSSVIMLLYRLLNDIGDIDVLACTLRRRRLIVFQNEFIFLCLKGHSNLFSSARETLLLYHLLVFLNSFLTPLQHWKTQPERGRPFWTHNLHQKRFLSRRADSSGHQ